MFTALYKNSRKSVAKNLWSDFLTTDAKDLLSVDCMKG